MVIHVIDTASVPEMFSLFFFIGLSLMWVYFGTDGNVVMALNIAVWTIIQESYKQTQFTFIRTNSVSLQHSSLTEC